MIRVNFLAPATERGPVTWRRRLVAPPEQRAALFGAAMLVTAAGAMGFWHWSVIRERRAVDLDLAAAEVAMTRMQDAARLTDATAGRERALRDRLSLIDQLRSTQRAPVVLLDTISRSLPEGMWLVELHQAGQSVQIEGRAVSHLALTEFMDRLQTSDLFVRPIDIVNARTETIADTSVVRFAIRGEVGTRGGA